MAKDSPWFKFIPSEWNDGQISLCTYAAKGLFIDLCALYWSREGDLARDFAQAKLTTNPDLWGELFARDVYTLDEGKIKISFLDEQLIERVETSEKARQAALKRWGKTENGGPNNRLGDYKKPRNGVKNAAALDAHSDQNASGQEAHCDPYANKKEKRKDKIPVSDKDTGKSKGEADNPKTLPPLRAAGFLDGKPQAEVWKSYAERVYEFADSGQTPERMAKGLIFFWPSEIDKKTQSRVIEHFEQMGEFMPQATLGQLAEELENLNAEALVDVLKFIGDD